MRTHPQPLQVVVAALGSHGRSSRPLGDPARHEGTGPEAISWCWSLDGGGQFLLLLDGQQGAGTRSAEFAAPVPESPRALPVVAMDHAAGIVVVQADEAGSMLDGEVIGDQREELPAACLNRSRGMTRSLGELRSGEVGEEGEAACHVAA